MHSFLEIAVVEAEVHIVGVVDTVVVVIDIGGLVVDT